MAVIEYRITVDANGNATVVEDVREIDKGDTLIFTTDGQNVSPGMQLAIKHIGTSPFLSHGPVANEVFIVQPGLGAPVSSGFAVEQSNADQGAQRATRFGQRKVFHFQCGEADPAEGKTQTTFRTWAGDGASDPGGGGGRSDPPPPPPQ